MPASNTNATLAAGSLILTTLVTHCRPLPATQGPVTLPYLGLGAGGGGGQAQEAEAGGRTYSHTPRDAKVLRKKGGGDKFDKSGYDVNGTRTEEVNDHGAVMYIIVVLVFYSTGVMVMIVRYLRTEKKELEEEVTLENFFKSMPDKQAEKEHRVNTVAIRAFHTLTSISYEDEELDKHLGLGGEESEEERVKGRDSPGRRSDTSSCLQPLIGSDL